MNKQEVGYKKAMLCLLLGLSSKYQSSLVSLAKARATWQAEPLRQESCGFQWDCSAEQSVRLPPSLG